MQKAYYISDILEITGYFKRHEYKHYEWEKYPNFSSRIEYHFSFYDKENDYIEFNFDDIRDVKVNLMSRLVLFLTVLSAVYEKQNDSHAGLRAAVDRRCANDGFRTEQR